MPIIPTYQSSRNGSEPSKPLLTAQRAMVHNDLKRQNNILVEEVDGVHKGGGRTGISPTPVTVRVALNRPSPAHNYAMLRQDDPWVRWD